MKKFVSIPTAEERLMENVMKKYLDDIEALLGHKLDGVQKVDGFSIQDALDGIHLDLSPEEVVEEIKSRPLYTKVDAMIQYPLEKTDGQSS